MVRKATPDRGGSRKPRCSCQQTSRQLETRCGRESHTRPRGHAENPRCSCQQTPRGLETRCGRKSHTRPGGGPRKAPDGVDPNIRRTRHNVTVITGVKIWSLCSISSILSHATLQQPFWTLTIKWEVKILLKKSSCVFIMCLPSFMRLNYGVVVMLNERVNNYITIVLFVFCNIQFSFF